MTSKGPRVLTPEEIQSREFLVSLRGYDRDEVHAFLDEVAESFAALLAEGAPDAAAVDDAAVDDAAVDDTAVADVLSPMPGAQPEPAPVAAAPAPSPFAAIGSETQRILDAAQSAGEAILARAQVEATRARDEAMSAAEGDVAQLREQAAVTQRQIDVLILRRDEITDRLRQARDTAELALLELETADSTSDEPDVLDDDAALDDVDE